MLKRGGLAKGVVEGYKEVEVGEEDESRALTQQAERGESTRQKAGMST